MTRLIQHIKSFNNKRKTQFPPTKSEEHHYGFPSFSNTNDCISIPIKILYM